MQQKKTLIFEKAKNILSTDLPIVFYYSHLPMSVLSLYIPTV